MAGKQTKYRPVKCPYCGLPLDRNIEDFKVVGSRFAHPSCYENYLNTVAKEKEERQNIIDFADINIDNANFPLVNQQIKRFREKNNFTLSGIYKTLLYCKDIAHINFDSGNGGIGITEYYYDEAKDYYRKMEMVNRSNAEKEISSETITLYNPTDGRPKRVRGYRGFDFLDEEVKNGK